MFDAYNIPIFHAEEDIALKAFLKIVINRESSGSNDKLPRARWYSRPVRSDLPVKDLKKYLLSSIPGIGDQLSENLLMNFNTIHKVACASIEELKKVPKIGSKKAQIIYNLFHN